MILSIGLLILMENYISEIVFTVVPVISLPVTICRAEAVRSVERTTLVHIDSSNSNLVR